VTQSAASPHFATTAAIAPDRLSRFGLLAVVAWLFLQGTLRILTASSLGIDEAQLLVTAQSLEWGYGPQPPLYSWLQYGIFVLFGPTIPALVYTKEAMLAGTFILFFLASRLVLGEERRALVATLLLFTIPQIVWESQRALSHSVLVLLLGAAALYLFLRILRNGRPIDYVLFGLTIGLGLLSKYNFAILAMALVGAALFSELGRQRVLSGWFVLSLGLAALITAPHFHWGLTHLDMMLSSSGKFEIEANIPLLDRLALPILGAGIAIASFSAITALIVAIVALAPPKRSAPVASVAWPQEGGDFIIRLFVVAVAVVVATPLLSGATVVMDRWLMPVLFFVPLPLLVVFDRRLSAPRLRLLAVLAIVSAVVCSAGLTAAALLPDLVGRGLRGTEPYAMFADTIRREVPDPAYILSEGTSVAGNLRLAFPDATALTSSHDTLPLRRRGTVPVVVAWTGEDAMPSVLQERVAALCAGAPVELPSPTPLREPYEHSRTLFFDMRYDVIEDCQVPE
jgi:4-amino-4-deoxy-L-arabinose transferase-like glycosyltransferase